MTGSNTMFLVSFLLTLLGFALKRLGVFDERAGQSLTRLALYVTIPAVILNTVPRIPLTRSLLLFPLVCLAAGTTAFFLALGLSRRYEPRSRGVVIMSSLGYNNGLFAFPIAQAVWGVVGVQYLAVFDLANALLLLGLNYLVAAWYGARAAGRPPELSLGYVLGNLLRSVPLLTYAVAVLMNLLGLRLPALADTLVEVTARANMPVVLVLLGVYLDFRLPREEIGAAAMVLALRLLIGVSFGLSLYFLLPLDALFRKVLLVGLLLPVGATVAPFAAAFGLNHRLAALATNVSLVLGFVLFWAVVNLL